MSQLDELGAARAGHIPRPMAAEVVGSLRPRTVATTLASIALFLCGLDWTFKFVQHMGWHVPGIVMRMLWRFDVDRESTIPTLFSVLILLAAATLAWLAGRIQAQPRRFARQWYLLAVLLVYLAIDEWAEVHEYVLNHVPVVVINRMGGKQETFAAYESVFPWYWVLPAAVLVLIVGLYFLRFVLARAKMTRNLFLLAASLFVAGALGGEFVGSHYVERAGRANLGYITLAVAEELLEMLGVIVLLYALLHHLRAAGARLTMTFGTLRESDSAAPPGS